MLLIKPVGGKSKFIQRNAIVNVNKDLEHLAGWMDRWMGWMGDGVEAICMTAELQTIGF